MDDGQQIIFNWPTPMEANNVRAGSYHTFIIDPSPGQAPIVARFGSTDNATFQDAIVQNNGVVTTTWEWTPDVGDAEALTGPIRVTRTITLLRDVARVQFDIQNTDSRPHTIGMMTHIDTAVAGDAVLPQPIEIPVLADRGRVRFEVSLTGASRIPPIVEWFRPEWLDDPLIGPQGNVRLTLKNTQNISDIPVSPDRLVVGSWERLANVDWNYTA
ncbi:MAG: hypothetical protein C4321_06630, partial [Chloroflexota bacterium]